MLPSKRFRVSYFLSDPSDNSVCHILTPKSTLHVSVRHHKFRHSIAIWHPVWIDFEPHATTSLSPRRNAHLCYYCTGERFCQRFPAMLSEVLRVKNNTNDQLCTFEGGNAKMYFNFNIRFFSA